MQRKTQERWIVARQIRKYGDLDRVGVVETMRAPASVRSQCLTAVNCDVKSGNRQCHAEPR